MKFSWLLRFFRESRAKCGIAFYTLNEILEEFAFPALRFVCSVSSLSHIRANETFGTVALAGWIGDYRAAS
jgi:hypothetical protein